MVCSPREAATLRAERGGSDRGHRKRQHDKEKRLVSSGSVYSCRVYKFVRKAIERINEQPRNDRVIKVYIKNDEGKFLIDDAHPCENCEKWNG